MMIPVMPSRPLLARVAAYVCVLVVLTGCGRLKDMLTKAEADAGVDAGSVDAAVVVAAAPEDAGVPDAAVALVQTADDLPAPDSDEVKANRDIGFGNYKDELDKLEKEAEAAAKKK